jgi:hypothetical protein
MSAAVPGTSPGAPFPTPAAEAARYALLRRIAPSMRHHLVVNLQPIGMIYEVMERRLRVPVPDLANVQESANKINGFAKAALQSCLDVVGWLAPDDGVATSVQDGTRECALLLATSLSFRGYALRNETTPLAGTVRRSAIRTLLTAALVYCTDDAEAPADLVVTCASEADAAVITVTLRATDADKGFAAEASYRKLDAADLLALAAADGVGLLREGHVVQLRFPWLQAPAP